MATTQKVIMRLLDVQGKTGTTSFRITEDSSTNPAAAAAGYLASLGALSSCKILGAVGQTAANGDEGSAATNAYNVRDKLAVEYIGIEDNDHHVLHFPDPDPAIFMVTNFKDVDPTNAQYIGLKDAIEANVKTKLGGPVQVIRAYRQMSRHLKSSLRFV